VKQYTKPATNSEVPLLQQISNKELHFLSLNPNLTYLMVIMFEMAGHVKQGYIFVSKKELLH
jgi:hypothetical protein